MRNSSRSKPRKTPDSRAVPTGPTLVALQLLFDETVALYHRLTAAARQIHQQGELSAGRRGILRSLDRLGPQTVPQMARARPVSRQLIQTLVNQLAQEGFVEPVDNPVHKRSRLVRLTHEGKQLIDAMYRQETKVLSQAKIDIAEKDLQAAAAVLRAVRNIFQGEQ